MEQVRRYIVLFLKGIGMGSADVVPGVSGGTIAFITGIYDELISSIGSVDKTAVQYLLKGRFKDFWQHINGTFLVVLLSGIAVSILSLAKLITYWLKTFPIATWSFFFGLIIISSLIVVRQVKKKTFGPILSGIAGLGIAFWITELSTAQTPETWWFVLLSGAIAICAMILPGISGSFILLILGKYEFILNAVKDMNIPVIILFAIGCVIGLLSFSKLINWLLKHYHDITVALLAGFMVGSLNKVWPWKKVLSYHHNSKGELVPLLEKNVLPNHYLDITGKDPQILEALLFAASGILLVFLLEKLAAYLQHRS